jgi:hypothetical protein
VIRAPNNFPRTDLVTAFLTGITGVNGTGATLAEMVRLNTALPATPAATQQSLGAALCVDPHRHRRHGRYPANPGCDVAGFPNGRRPGDDMTDLALRVVMGYLAPTAQSAGGELGWTDGAAQSAADFDNTFPYLKTPRPVRRDRPPRSHPHDAPPSSPRSPRAHAGPRHVPRRCARRLRGRRQHATAGPDA